MESFINLGKIIPGFQNGYGIQVVNVLVEDLEKLLAEGGFSVFKIEGSKFSDELSFMIHAKDVFDFPSYFGKNWNAWLDCLGDFEHSRHGHTAIIWAEADRSFSTDSKTFLRAIIDLYNMSMSASLRGNQIEFFVVGTSSGFKNILKVDS